MTRCWRQSVLKLDRTNDTRTHARTHTHTHAHTHTYVRTYVRTHTQTNTHSPVCSMMLPTLSMGTNLCHCRLTTKRVRSGEVMCLLECQWMLTGKTKCVNDCDSAYTILPKHYIYCSDIQCVGHHLNASSKRRTLSRWQPQHSGAP